MATTNGLELVLTVPSGMSVSGFDRLQIYGSQEQQEWVATDVGAVLGMKEVRSVMRDFDDDEKGVRIVHTLGGPQKVITVKEMGLYRLVFASRKPEAVRFRKWVCGVVIPTIRQYGCYPAPAVRPEVKPPPGCDWSDVVRVLADGQRELVDVLLRVERAVLTSQEAVSNVPFLLELMSGQRSMTASIQQVMEVAVLAKEAAEDASKHACTALRIAQGHMKPDRKPSREAIRNKVNAELKLDPNRSNAEIVRVLWDEYQMPITGPTVGRIRRKMTESRFTLPDLYPGSGNG